MAGFLAKTEKGPPAYGQFSGQAEGLLVFSGKLGSTFHIYGKLIYAHESTCFEVNQQDDGESAE